jgi:hypothetical protein
MSISAAFEPMNPFEEARKKPLMPLWKPGASYVLVRWDDGLACGRMTQEPRGRRIYLRGRLIPPAGTAIQVRVPRITDAGPCVDEWTVSTVEHSDAKEGAVTLWITDPKSGPGS